MDIPRILLDYVRQGQVVLFLGAGATFGAVHPNAVSPPSGQQLADLIAMKFLSRRYVGQALPRVADLAISESSLSEVQRFVATQFQDFKPAAFHSLLARFTWDTILTTNYDLVVERAYETVEDRVQRLVPLVRDTQRIEDSLRSRDALPYYKLHGCITVLDDPALPLILTPDQYITHRRGRARLFERFESLSRDRTLVFVGHSLGDLDIRAVLLEMSERQESTPRAYFVAPDADDVEARYWESRRLTVLRGTFADFMANLDASVPATARRLAKLSSPSQHPVLRHLKVPLGSNLSDGLSEFLDYEVEFVHGGLRYPRSDAHHFYSGFFSDWGPIGRNLDIRRRLTDDILSEMVITPEAERTSRQEFAVIKGHAGAGKRVTLHRLAWDAATTYDALCLLLRDSRRCEYDRLAELARLANKRLFLFVDDAVRSRDLLAFLLSRARTDKLDLSIIATVRTNEWNVHGDSLLPHVTHEYELRYLSEAEVDVLVTLLKEHRSLGHLEGLPLDEQRKAFAQRAGRQILVALQEATTGKPFTEILFDEYTHIPTETAKTLYRTVCILDRLHVETRAGLIAVCLRQPCVTAAQRAG
jgi:hypothetical protein